MKKTTMLLSAMALLFLVSLSSCQKDWAEQWIGTYTGTAGSNTFNRVVVSKVNNKTIKMELQTLVLGSPYTYATIGNGKLNSETTVSISEDGTVAGYSGTYTFTGGGTINGNTLTVSGAAAQPGASTLYYTFTGSK